MAMKLVLCLTDNKEWDAEEFSSLERQSFDLRRRHLICLACGGRAFLRKSAHNGRPTFGARHAEGCKVHSPGWTAFRYLQ